MIGFGPEDTHFVLELTANTGIKSYALGNDFRHIALRKTDSLAQRCSEKHILIGENDNIIVTDTDNYAYKLVQLDEADRYHESTDPVLYVSLSTPDLQRCKQFYTEVLGMKVYRQDENSILVGYASNQSKLEFVQLDKGVELKHGEAFGRLAIATPSVSHIHDLVQRNNVTVVTGPIVLSTPGKADVEVIIIQDPDGYEICYADEKGFYALALGQAEN